MTTNLLILSNEIGRWADRNFKIHLPELGIGEEVGELIHCVLKHRQKIRGMDNPDTFRAAIVDALGDAAVYVLHWCFRNNVYIQEGRRPVAKVHSVQLEEAYLSALLALSAEYLGNTTNPSPTHIWIKLYEFALLHGLDLIEDCLIPTWNQVKTRDWQKFPTDGRTK